MKKKLVATILLLSAICPMRTEAAMIPESVAVNVSATETVYIPNETRILLRRVEERVIAKKSVVFRCVVAEEGDTLASLSKRLHVDEDVLELVNPEHSEHEGVLELNATVAITEMDWENLPMEVYYIVEEGDTLEELGQQFCSTVEELVEWNPQIENPDLIIENDIMRVN